MNKLFLFLGLPIRDQETWIQHRKEERIKLEDEEKCPLNEVMKFIDINEIRRKHLGINFDNETLHNADGRVIPEFEKEVCKALMIYPQVYIRCAANSISQRLKIYRTFRDFLGSKTLLYGLDFGNDVLQAATNLDSVGYNIHQLNQMAAEHQDIEGEELKLYQKIYKIL